MWALAPRAQPANLQAPVTYHVSIIDPNVTMALADCRWNFCITSRNRTSVHPTVVCLFPPTTAAQVKAASRHFDVSDSPLIVAARLIPCNNQLSRFGFRHWSDVRCTKVFVNLNHRSSESGPLLVMPGSIVASPTVLCRNWWTFFWRD